LLSLQALFEASQTAIYILPEKTKGALALFLLKSSHTTLARGVPKSGVKASSAKTPHHLP